MEKGVAITLETFKKALKHKDLKIIYGTDANAGAHGQNYREFIVRVRDGGQDPMQALISATSLAAESLNLAKEIGSIAPGMQADIAGFDGDPLKGCGMAALCSRRERHLGSIGRSYQEGRTTSDPLCVSKTSGALWNY